MIIRTVGLLLLILSTWAIARAQRAPLESFSKDSLKNINLDIRNDKYGKISSLVIYQGTRLVYENYYGFSQRSTLHPISSVTKSVTSIAAGIAIDMDSIPSLNVKIHKYFPEYDSIFREDPLKREITLRHLLNQTAGFKWDEWKIHYSYAGNPLIEMSQKNQNWIPLILSLPMGSEPGEIFSYNSACSELVKEIISRATGVTFHYFVEHYVLEKLNVSKYNWDTYPKNDVPAWGGLSMSTLDMAKIGLLVINQGYWAANRIVSDEWIATSVEPQSESDSLSYGYHWWVTKQPDGNPLVFAAGYGDQYVYIAPDKNIVVAFNGKNFTDYKWEKNHSDLINRILSAYVN
ncbi:MAG: serine hydrolase domain-containing protein [Bacteroidales bacterium]